MTIEVLQYIPKNMLVLIPVLYIFGAILKSSKLKDEHIPKALLVSAILFSISMNGFNPNSVILGFLVTGLNIGISQFVIQEKKLTVNNEIKQNEDDIRGLE